jgi:hypothetical protein
MHLSIGKKLLKKNFSILLYIYFLFKVVNSGFYYKKYLMSDINVIKTVESLRDSIQKIGVSALSKFSKQIASNEEPKAIEGESVPYSDLELQESGALQLSKYVQKDSKGLAKVNEVFIAPKEESGIEKDKIMRTKMNFSKDGKTQLQIEELCGNFGLENHSKFWSGEIDKNELFNELLKNHELYKEGGSLHHGYSKMTCSVDDNNNFSISSSNSSQDIWV